MSHTPLRKGQLEPEKDNDDHERHHSRTSTSSSSSFFTFPVQYSISGLIRRLNSDVAAAHPSPPLAPSAHNTTSAMSASMPHLGPRSISLHDGILAQPRRTHSPFQPPPLTPLVLEGYGEGSGESARLLSRTVAEEIRLLVPSRLQLADRWRLAYSLEEHGVSLGTLYQRCVELKGKRGGFVLVVKDGAGGLFGAYLSDPPAPDPHFFGNGECFLWRASTLSSIPTLDSLPPPPSADTTNAVRMTTLSSSAAKLRVPKKNSGVEGGSRSGTATPERIRFKAFPYSGVNDYMIFCEMNYLSIGGGDGHYGLWLDDSLANGISDSCPTFGNEPLSEEGRKFEVIGVEIWYLGL